MAATEWAESLSFPAQTCHSKRAVSTHRANVSDRRRSPGREVHKLGDELGAAVAADACFFRQHSDNQHCFSSAVALHLFAVYPPPPTHHPAQRQLLWPVGSALDRVMSVCSGVSQPIRPSRRLPAGDPRRPKTSDRGPFSQAMDRCQGLGCSCPSLSRCLVSLVSKLPPAVVQYNAGAQSTRRALAVKVAQKPPRVMVWLFLIPDDNSHQCGPRAR